VATAAGDKPLSCLAEGMVAPQVGVSCAKIFLAKHQVDIAKSVTNTKAVNSHFSRFGRLKLHAIEA
jgi:hypothetical protein